MGIRSLFLGFPDYTGADLPDIELHLREWRDNTDDVIDWICAQARAQIIDYRVCFKRCAPLETIYCDS